jgi:hypothetical protein
MIIILFVNSDQYSLATPQHIVCAGSVPKSAITAIEMQFPTYLKFCDIVFRSSLFHPVVLTQVEAVHFDLLPFIRVNLLNTR